MITFFTIPKPFKGHISLIQRNAIQSWLHLHPDCEIIFYGNDDGIGEIANEFGLIHIPDIKKNEHGTPFLDFVFNHAQSIAKNNILCYANADIIFFKDFTNSIQNVKKDPFLVVGQRCDINLTQPLHFSDENWEDDLRTMVKNNGKYISFGIDFFAFSKTTQIKILPFLVGRAGWDGWMMYNARKKGIPIIDISPTTMIIHQIHDYNHVPFKNGINWLGPESDYNMNLTGNKFAQKVGICTNWGLNQSDYYLTFNGLHQRQRGLYDNTYKKFILFCPEFLYPVIGIIELTIIRSIGKMIRYGNKIRNKYFRIER